MSALLRGIVSQKFTLLAECLIQQPLTQSSTWFAPRLCNSDASLHASTPGMLQRCPVSQLSLLLAHVVRYIGHQKGVVVYTVIMFPYCVLNGTFARLFPAQVLLDLVGESILLPVGHEPSTVEKLTTGDNTTKADHN